MPGTGAPLSDAYSGLFSQSGVDFDFQSMTDEDALLLLTALWSDVVHVYRLFSGNEISEDVEPQGPQSQLNLLRHCDPFAPLSPAVERARLQDKFQVALSNWDNVFATTVSDDIVALYQYCKMIASCAEILSLPSLAGYSPVRKPQLSKHGNTASNIPSISNETRDLAILVLAHATAKSGDPATRVQIWLPVVVFHAGLAVWAHTIRGQAGQERKLRILSSFTRVLDGLPWPCCKEMVNTLQRCAGATLSIPAYV